MRRALLAVAAMFGLAAPGPPPSPLATDGFDAPPLLIGQASGPGVPLRVMTYNVHGLPWPIIEDRSAALDAIGDRLRAMRRQGTAPDVVVLQEAFSGEARAIASRAGYRYTVEGPASEDAAPPFAEKPLPDRYAFRGEGYGAYLGSGLVLMSNHPILASWRAAFPRTACAGYDCLANKGVLLARIAMPGLSPPVQIMATHVNSLKPTRTPAPHANAAFTRQMAAIDRFVAAHADARFPLIVAADLNLDANPQRIAALTASQARWKTAQDDQQDTAVVAICGKPYVACHPGIGLGAITAHKRNNDWQFAFAGRDAAIWPEAASLRFQPDNHGRTLSDHQALMVDYRVSSSGQKAPEFALRATQFRAAHGIHPVRKAAKA
jgi:endonuclease/exonuclease/phosphatase family metal-dependent hydrolase